MAKTKPLSDLEWCKLAVSRDEGRPVLTGIHVNLAEKRIEATDGHRLHFTRFAPFEPTNFQAGIFKPNGDAILGAKIEGTYPNTGPVIPEFDWSPGVLFDGRSTCLTDARAICKAGAAANRATGEARYFVTLKTHNGGIASYDPAYMLDALAMWPTGPLQVFAPHPLHPARIQDPNGARVAILMPVRREVADTPGQERFSLDEFLTYAEGAKPGEVSLSAPISTAVA